MANVNWVGGHSSSFSDPLNWNPQTVPGTTSDVRIRPAAATTVNAGDATINSLLLGAHATLAIASQATFTIVDKPDAANPAGTSSNNGQITVAGAADLRLAGGFTNAGLLSAATNSDVWVEGSLTNTGRMQMSADLHVGTATVTASVENASGARYAISGAADIRGGGLAGSVFTNDGLVTRTGAGSTDVTTAFINHGNVTLGAGGMAFLGGLTNTGVITEHGAHLSVSGAIAGTGAIDLVGGGTVELGAGADAGQTVDFLSGSGLLALHSPAIFKGTLADFSAGDKVMLDQTTATGLSYAGGVLTVSNGASTVAQLHFSGSYTTASFVLSSDGHGDAVISHS